METTASVTSFILSTGKCIAVAEDQTLQFLNVVCLFG